MHIHEHNEELANCNRSFSKNEIATLFMEAIILKKFSSLSLFKVTLKIM